MPLEKYRHPVLFYVLATAIPWAFWFAAAYLSHITPTNQLLATAVGVLGVVGLLGPTIIAFWMIWPQADLRNDLARRMIGLKGIRPLYLFLTCFLMLGSILLAQAISLLFGYSAEQFSLSGKSSFSAGIFPGWFLLFLAPLIEELAVLQVKSQHNRRHRLSHHCRVLQRSICHAPGQQGYPDRTPVSVGNRGDPQGQGLLLAARLPRGRTMTILRSQLRQPYRHGALVALCKER